MWLINLCLATVAVASLYLLGAWQVRRTQAEHPPIGQFVTVEGIRLHYVSKGHGEPVVFLHGAGGALQEFTAGLLDRAAQEYRAIAFDRPGHGYSDRLRNGGATPAAQARLIRGAIRELGGEKPVLVGHSWGGALVLACALQFPEEVSGVVVLSGAVCGDDRRLATLSKFPWVAMLGHPALSTPFVPVSRLLTKLILRRAFYPDPVPGDYPSAVRCLASRPSQMRANLEDLAAVAPALKEMSAEYDKIRVPVVIVTGDSDKIVGPERHAYWLHERIPGSKLIVLPRTGHMPHFTQPEAVLSAIRMAEKQQAILELSGTGRADVIKGLPRPLRRLGE